MSAEPITHQELQKIEFEGKKFDDLLERTFEPTNEKAQTAIERAVNTLAVQALANATLVSGNSIKTIEDMIKALDDRLAAQVNLIIHHPDFLKLESAWRGLYHLVNNTETDDQLRIKFLNVTKEELGETLTHYKGMKWDQSPIFKLVYTQEFDMLGGTPYGCLVGDYEFDHTPPDVDLLGEMSKICAAAHTPFIAAASPKVMELKSWQQLGDKHDLKSVFSTPLYAGWSALRDSPDSRYIGLTMPRFLSRLPYDPLNAPAPKWKTFVEDVSKPNHDKYVWANSAYAMATNITRSFKLYGWCSRIRGVESGGVLDELPTHTFPTDDGGVDMKCPTEIAISDRRENELANCGFMPLTHRKNTNVAAFIGAQSLHNPPEFYDADATANAKLGARLPYLFACCRFAHYLKCIVRDKIGGFAERKDMQKYLSDWIRNYVDGAPEHSSETVKATKPLAAAEVKVEEVAGNPGWYTSQFFLRPHYQLEGLTVSLSLVSKLPSERKA